MPSEIRIGRQAMLDGVMDMIEREGHAAVSARAVAQKLGISTQPIYREFGDMSGLMAAALQEGLRIFAEYLAGDAMDGAIKYVMFASERGKLFDFLFRGKHYEYDGLDDMSHSLMKDTDIIARLGDITGLQREKVYRVHLCVWMALHGLACMSADNKVAFDRGEVSEFVKDITRALAAYYAEK